MPTGPESVVGEIKLPKRLLDGRWVGKGDAPLLGEVLLDLGEFLLCQGPIIDQDFVDGAVEKAVGFKLGFTLSANGHGATAVVAGGQTLSAKA